MLNRIGIILKNCQHLKQNRAIYFFSKESEWEQKDFYHKTQIQIDSIGDQIENGIWGDKIEVDITEGVLKIITPYNKTFVINRQVYYFYDNFGFQTPNRQIWYSSPVSGPCRFNFENGQWMNTRGEILDKLIQKELEILMK